MRLYGPLEPFFTKEWRRVKSSSYNKVGRETAHVGPLHDEGCGTLL